MVSCFNRKSINEIGFAYGGSVYVFPADYWCIYECCKGMKDYLEIGSMFGASAIIAGYGVSGEVHCIEPFGVKGDKDRQIKGCYVTEENLRENWERHHDTNRLVIHPQYHPPMPEAISGRRFDIAFIDGCHEYEAVKIDLAGVARITNKLILVHDIFDSEMCDRPVKNAYLEFVDNNAEWEHVKYKGCVGVLRRKE